jgi:hypothetical protein
MGAAGSRPPGRSDSNIKVDERERAAANCARYACCGAIFALAIRTRINLAPGDLTSADAPSDGAHNLHERSAHEVLERCLT